MPFGQLRSATGAKSLLVPNNAIVRPTEREYVIAVRDGKANLIDIKKGMAGKDLTEVFGALRASDHIVLKASYEVKEGDMIK